MTKLIQRLKQVKTSLVQEDYEMVKLLLCMYPLRRGFFG